MLQNEHLKFKKEGCYMPLTLEALIVPETPTVPSSLKTNFSNFALSSSLNNLPSIVYSKITILS